MNHLDLVKKLFKAIEETDISEFSYEEEGIKIKIRRDSLIPHVSAPRMMHAPPVTEGHHHRPAPVAQASPPVEDSKSETESHQYIPVTSPFVGTFYRSAAPGTPPFIEEGREVHPGDVLCIVEAMKLMNEIECERHARVAKILIENGAPVEFGQELILLELLS